MLGLSVDEVVVVTSTEELSDVVDNSRELLEESLVEVELSDSDVVVEENEDELSLVIVDEDAL